MGVAGLPLEDIGNVYYELSATANVGPYGNGVNTIVYNTEDRPNRFLTYDPVLGEVTVAGKHIVLIVGRTGGVGTGSNSRTRFDTFLELDAGGIGVWTEVGKTRNPHYLRQSNQGDATFFLRPFLLEDGDKFRMRVERRNGNGLFLLETNYANLQVFMRTLELP